jgi:arylsulfatase A-like enzyme
MYRGMDLPTPNKSDSEKHQAHPLYQAFMQQPHSKTYAQDDFRNHALPTYYGLVKEIDDNLGRLFASLEQQGQSERTMIVLTSDHGDYFGDHWLGEKDLFHDPVTRVPLIIMDPTSAADGSRGTQCDELTCAIDLVPTFVEWAGGEPQWQWLEGQSLLPVLHHSPSSQQTQPAVISTSAARSYVVSECDYSAMGFAGALGRNSYNARMTMLFDGRYKYIHCLGFKPMLYDLQEDPQERVDLGRDKGYVDVRSQLTEQMMDWSAGLKNRVTGSESMVQQRMGKSDEKGILIGYWQQEDVPQALQLDPEVPLK